MSQDEQTVTFGIKWYYKCSKCHSANTKVVYKLIISAIFDTYFLQLFEKSEKNTFDCSYHINYEKMQNPLMVTKIKFEKKNRNYFLFYP